MPWIASVTQSTLLLCTVMFMSLVVTSVIASSFDDWDGSLLDDDVIMMEKRESAVKQCQRCLQFRNTKHKSRCNVCSGIIAGYKRKRSSFPVPVEVEEVGDVEEDVNDLMLAYNCCRQLGISECCQRSERLVAKRGYETSYFPMEEYGNGQCSCCNSAGPFEYSCCSLNCSKRK